jgi:tetratricopeptide (TPR) repeat protein
MPTAAERTALMALAMVVWLAGCVAPRTHLSHWDASGSAVEIGTPDFVPQDRYPSVDALRAQIRSQGLLALALHSAQMTADAVAQVRAGQPVLVRLKRGLPFAAHFDYAALLGVDPANDRVLLRSASRAAQWMNFGDFSAAWRAAGDWALVAAPPQRVPSFATVDDWLSEAANLATLQPDATRRAYEAATRRWPESAAAWLALARWREAHADLDGATLAYAAAVRVEPLNAATHARLAQLLLARQCADQAEDEIEQALRYETEPQRRAQDQRLLAQIRDHGGPSVVCPLEARDRD